MLLLGLLASQVDAVVPLDSDYDLLQTYQNNNNTSSFVFSNLVSSYAGTYQHLQLRLSMKDTDTLANTQNLFLRLDGGVGSYTHYLGTDSTGIVSEYKNDNWIRIRSGTTKGGDTYGYSASVIDILDAFETNKRTVVRSLSGQVTGNSAGIWLGSGFRMNTSSGVDSITLDGNDPIKSGSRASLYGIKVS